MVGSGKVLEPGFELGTPATLPTGLSAPTESVFFMNQLTVILPLTHKGPELLY